jgi:hypothetical protein
MLARVSGDRTNSSASRRSSNRSVPSSSFRWSSVSTTRPGIDAVVARTRRRVSRYVCDTGRPTVCRPCRFRGGSIAVASDLGGLCRRRFEGPCQSCSELAAGQSLCPRAVPSATVADGLGGRDLCWPCCEGAWAARVGRGRSAARDASLSSALAGFGHARIFVRTGRLAIFKRLVTVAPWVGNLPLSFRGGGRLNEHSNELADRLQKGHRRHDIAQYLRRARLARRSGGP